MVFKGWPCFDEVAIQKFNVNHLHCKWRICRLKILPRCCISCQKWNDSMPWFTGNSLELWIILASFFCVSGEHNIQKKMCMLCWQMLWIILQWFWLHTDFYLSLDIKNCIVIEYFKSGTFTSHIFSQHCFFYLIFFTSLSSKRITVWPSPWTLVTTIICARWKVKSHVLQSIPLENGSR